VRALQAESKVPGQIRFQVLVMQFGRNLREFVGRYDIVLSGRWTTSRGQFLNLADQSSCR